MESAFLSRPVCMIARLVCVCTQARLINARCGDRLTTMYSPFVRAKVALGRVLRCSEWACHSGGSASRWLAGRLGSCRRSSSINFVAGGLAALFFAVTVVALRGPGTSYVSKRTVANKHTYIYICRTLTLDSKQTATH